MSDSVRFCKQIPRGVYDRFNFYARSCGLSERDAFISLVNQFTKRIDDKSDSATITPPQPQPNTSTPAPTPTQIKPEEPINDVQYWKRKEPLTKSEIAELVTLNSRMQKNENMPPIERTKYYAYVERYQEYNQP